MTSLALRSIARRLGVAALVAAALAIAAAPARASVIFVLSETPSAGFESMPVYEDFEAVTPKDTNLTTPIVSNGITYTAVTGCGDPIVCPGNLVVTGVPYFNFAVPVTSGSILTESGNEYFTIEPSFTVRSLGFDIYTINEAGNPYSVAGAKDVLVSVLTSSGTSVLDVPAPVGNFGFLGIISDDPILEVTWMADLGGVKNTGIDNLRLSESTPAVPEPGTMLLLGSGISGLALRRRRRS